MQDWNGGKGAVTYSRVYVDANGETWVMVDKAYSILDDAWVNVDADAPASETQATAPRQQEETKPAPQINHQDVLSDVGIWVAVLTVVTGMLLLLMKKKR